MNESTVSNTHFRETQGLGQSWVWLVLPFSIIAWVIGILHYRHHGIHIISASSLVIMLVWLFFAIVAPLLVLVFELQTEIRSDGVYVRMFPFQLSPRKIKFSEFKRYELKTYHLPDYSGWGFTYGKRGRAYSLGGREGILFTFLDGRQVLIGSRRINDFINALHANCSKRTKA